MSLEEGVCYDQCVLLAKLFAEISKDQLYFQTSCISHVRAYFNVKVEVADTMV